MRPYKLTNLYSNESLLESRHFAHNAIMIPYSQVPNDRGFQINGRGVGNF